MQTAGASSTEVRRAGAIGRRAAFCLPIGDSLPPKMRDGVKKREGRIGTSLASELRVAEASMPLVYREPTVMWRMCRGDGLSSHAIIRLHRDGPLVIWFLNNKPVGCRGFKDVTSALNFTDRMQAQNWTAGWRLVD